MALTRLFVLAVVTAVGAVVVMGVPVGGQPKLPPDFAFEQMKDSPGPVTFSHEKHKNAGVEKCTACHTKLFKMKKGTTGIASMAKMKAGEQCGTCHTGKPDAAGKPVFAVGDQAKCDTCHKKSS